LGSAPVARARDGILAIANFSNVQTERCGEAYRKVISVRRSFGFYQHKLHQHAKRDDACALFTN
jgi:hypothetical protein